MKTILVPTEGYASNSWLIVDEHSREAALVDPSADLVTVNSVLDENHAHIVAILLTHGHFDHMLSLKALRNATGAPLMIHEADAPCLTDASKSEFLSFLGKNVVFDAAERLLHNGDMISLGNETLKVIHTPGHTLGSVCFLYKDALITGDTLFRGSIGRTDLFGGNGEEMLSSLRNILSLPEETALYPGHGPSTILSREKRFNPYLRGVL